MEKTNYYPFSFKKQKKPQKNKKANKKPTTKTQTKPTQETKAKNQNRALLMNEFERTEACKQIKFCMLVFIIIMNNEILLKILIYI